MYRGNQQAVDFILLFYDIVSATEVMYCQDVIHGAEGVIVRAVSRSVLFR
jgi:hypothetical protein